MLDICVSFDYELFFGQNNGTVEEILFSPTDKLLKLLKEENISTTFFADICSYIRHSELFGEDCEYCVKFSDQLKQMLKNRQDIQLHIHPHWMHSYFADEKWIFDQDHYKLQDFGYESDYKLNVQSIVSKGITAIKTILGKDYNCIAFRAGGLSIQPEDKLIEILHQNGILIDSSIAPGMRTIGGKEGYDFKAVQRKTLNWRISTQNGISQNDSSSKENVLFEVPVATVKNNIFRLLTINPKKLRLNTNNINGTFFKSEKISFLLKSIRKLHTFYRRMAGYSMLSLDTKGYELLLKELSAIYKRYNCSQKDAAITLICHPKMLSDQAIANIKSLIDNVKKHPNKYNFCNMTDIANKYISTGGV